MTKAEKLEAYLKEELYDIYCHNCKHIDHDENDNCDYCHRKNMYWQVSDEVIAKAVEIATEDIEDLTRCRDCKAYLPETETLASYCPILDLTGLPEDAYCFKAKRKDNDQS